MKNAIIGMISVIIIILVSVAVSTSATKTVRKNELDSKMSTVMNQTLKILLVDKWNAINHVTDSDLASNLVQGLLASTSSKSDLKIEVIKADAKKGILSVKATEKFSQVYGVGKVSCSKTVILDSYDKTINQDYSVTFKQDILEGNKEEPITKEVILYSSKVKGGTSMNSTMLPTNVVFPEGYKLQGWKLISPDNGVIYDNSSINRVVVVGNITFKAVFVK